MNAMSHLGDQCLIALMDGIKCPAGARAKAEVHPLFCGNLPDPCPPSRKFGGGETGNLRTVHLI
jgi:hypothetical protein